MGMNLETVGTGLEMKLLWTNPNPKTAFSPQTVNLNGEFPAFCVSFFAAANNTLQMQTQIVVADEGAATQRIVFVNYYTSVGSRDVNVYKNALYFGNSNSGSGGVVDNTKIIPYQIYGIQA